MEYEVAVTPSASVNEMVKDVVVEEMTNTLSPSGVEKKSIWSFYTMRRMYASHIEPHTNLQLL